MNFCSCVENSMCHVTCKMLLIGHCHLYNVLGPNQNRLHIVQKVKYQSNCKSNALVQKRLSSGAQLEPIFADFYHHCGHESCLALENQVERHALCKITIDTDWKTW